MTLLLVFVCGMMFYGFVLPLLNDIAELVDAKKTLRISAINVGIAANNKEIEDLSNGGQGSASAIGFHYDDSEYEYDDDEDDDPPDEEDSYMGRIGF